MVDSGVAAADVARAALAGARAQAQQAAASLQQAELNLAMTAIYSPIDGVVISRSVDVGQTVAASLQAPTIFTLAEDLRKMQVEAHVAEGDVGKLAAGHGRSASPSTRSPGRSSAGTLRQVRNAATTVQNVVTYDAIVDVDNPDLKLRPGMTANVSFVVADRDDVLRIPNAALRFRPDRRRPPRRLPRNPAAGARRAAPVLRRRRPTGKGLRAHPGAGRRHRRQPHRAGRGRRCRPGWRWSPTWAAASRRAAASPHAGDAGAAAMGMPGMGGPGMGTGGGRRERRVADDPGSRRPIMQLIGRQQDLPAGRDRRARAARA